MNRAQLFVVIPAYNEERNIGRLLESINVSSNCSTVRADVHVVVVDHQSTDKTEREAIKFSRNFQSFTILKEDYPKRCGGKPRNKGFLYTLHLLKHNLKEYSKNAIISTVDADSIVSKMFVEEIVCGIDKGFELITFNERYDPVKIKRWINSQENLRKATKIIGGMSWIRYQFLWALSLSGIRETRGSAGYAILPKNLERLSHFQPFNKEGDPITGENNRLGIKAKSMGMSVYTSPFTSLSNPRREMFSLNLMNTNKGYGPDKDMSETFAIAREERSRELQLNSDSSVYLKLSLKRMIRMLLIRAIAFEKLDSIYWLWPFSYWQEIIGVIEEFLKIRPVPREQLEVVGNGIYNEIFEYVNQKMGNKKMDRFLDQLFGLIPDYRYLQKWVGLSKEVVVPDNNLISGLRDRFVENYSYV